ncbi:Vmc-like lipoprotein signal peptide domain-containing protein [Spiroplasma diminutum]|uniref:MOLPALP family lipoprotein n=1 Tax=Spiroplasma diminutum CUAS-1 TaxID=1276221 RepID=S5ME70_9MOLU|nr:hypothetical protein [Spiroplasma diminutum]AGR42023.1 hypothetical protein SDIMI_v3c03190 [Spiroplasma diminutum CUAS-1]
MKKLISLLGVVAITASTASVASCSTVNNVKTSIKNKISNLTQVSSALLRGAMIQNATQDLNKGYAYDAEYFNNLIDSSKANDLLPSFKTDNQTTIGLLGDNYFGKNASSYTRSSINELNNRTNPSYSNTLFLSNKVISPNTSIDNISGIITLIISAIKSNGGIHPSISGLLQGLLPQLPLNENSIESVSAESMKSVSDILNNFSDTIAILIKILANSKITYNAISNLLNANFLNAFKQSDLTTIIEGILKTLLNVDYSFIWKDGVLTYFIDTLINSILTMDNIENLTNKMIMNATVKRINNIFASLAGETESIIKDKSLLYTDIDYDFEKSMGNVMAKFFENMDDLNTSNIASLIPDILFVISGILQRITSIDFSLDQPTKHNDLYSYKGEVGKKEKPNLKFLKELGEKDFANSKFKTKRLIKNLSIAFDTKNNTDGLQLAKLIGLLFQTASSTSIDFNNPFGIPAVVWTTKLGKIFIDISGDYKFREGLSPIIYALGSGLGQWQNITIKIPIVGDIGPDQIGNLLRGSIDMVVEGRSINGLNALFNYLSPFGLKIDLRFSDESINIMKNSWTALWSKDSGFLKEITKGTENISLETILSGSVYNGKTISEVLNFIYNAINSSTLNTKRVKELEESSKGISSGLKNIASSLIDEKYSIYSSGDKDYLVGNLTEKTENKYTAIQTLMITASKPGLYLGIKDSDTEIKNSNVKGAKAAMYALGTDFDENGKQNNLAFRDNSLLLGLESIVDDTSVNSLLDQIMNGFSDVNKVKNDLSTTIYKPLIQSNNFKTKVNSYYGIDDGYKEAGITYTTTFIDPKSKKQFNYEIKLLLEANATEWQIYSIKRK